MSMSVSEEVNKQVENEKNSVSDGITGDDQIVFDALNNDSSESKSGRKLKPSQKIADNYDAKKLKFITFLPICLPPP